MAKKPPPNDLGPDRTVKRTMDRDLRNHKKQYNKEKEYQEMMDAKAKKQKPNTKARKIDFTPAVPTQKRASLEAREKREMPKRLGRDPWGDKTRKDMEMPKQIMGSTKAQRAASTLELMNDMRSRNLLRSRNLSRKPNKKGM